MRETKNDSKVYRKDDLENFITDATLHLFDNPEIVEKITDGVMEVNKKRLHDKSLKKVLIEERDQIQKSLDNIMKAIETGILTSTTKSRMEELEEQIALVNDKIAIEEYKEKTHSKKSKL